MAAETVSEETAEPTIRENRGEALREAVEPFVATTWYAPNQQCVHADTLGPAQVHATGATAGTPGSWTPAGSDPPNTVAELQAGAPLVITASPGTNWTVGQYIATSTAGSAGEANWNGTAWVAGRHA
jgi:hypothetical protein